MKKIALLALCAPLMMLAACGGGSPYRVETRDPVVQDPNVITQDRLDAIIRERQIDASRSGR